MEDGIKRSSGDGGALQRQACKAVSEREMRQTISELTPEERMAFFWMLSTLAQNPAFEEFPLVRGSSKA